MMLTTVDAVAADLAGDVAVEILRRHHGDLAVGGARGRARGEGEDNGESKSGDDPHGRKSVAGAGSGDAIM